MGVDRCGVSAGEAQLFAFGPVFLKNPSSIVLDEASLRLVPAAERLARFQPHGCGADTLLAISSYLLVGLVTGVIAQAPFDTLTGQAFRRLRRLWHGDPGEAQPAARDRP